MPRKMTELQALQLMARHWEALATLPGNLTGQQRMQQKRRLARTLAGRVLMNDCFACAYYPTCSLCAAALQWPTGTCSDFHEAWVFSGKPGYAKAIAALAWRRMRAIRESR